MMMGRRFCTYRQRSILGDPGACVIACRMRGENDADRGLDQLARAATSGAA
jgi:hypothetical protein